MRIAQGKTEVHNYVVQLPQDLQKVGKDAEGKLEEQFDQLSSDVDAKQDALVDTLAQKYVASRDALDSRIEDLKAANKGLVDKALDAVVGVVKTILKLKDMLFNVLAKAADVIGDIISDPIGFLSNLIGGIKDGLGRFVDNIGTHLKEGLMGWLFGALGDAGIKMPKSFDLAGIFELVMDVLGLTYRNIRGRVAKIVGEPVVSKMEETVDVFKMLVTDGPAALWTWIKDKVGDFQEMVFGGLKDFIIERVIKGGVMWLLSLLNPAAAFIKACKAIYDIVMFIVERGSQIMEFVNSVIDSIGAIARGQLSVAAEKVEGALARALPLAIGFLASLLGLSGISDKIRETIDKVRKPIEKVVDTVVMGAVKGFKKMFGGAIGWVKGKYEKGKQFVKDKATAAKEWGAGKVKGIKDRLTGRGDADQAAEATPAGGEAEHVAMANEAGDQLAQVDGGAKGYTDTRKDTIAKARQLEQHYTPMLEPGIAMTVHFKESEEEDQEDDAVDYEVVIAPNTTRVPRRTPVAKGFYPTGEDPKTRTLTQVWNDCSRDLDLPGEVGTDKEKRRRMAERELVRRLGKAPLVRAILDHDDGRTPRPFSSVAAEDAAVIAAHITDKHVFGMGLVPDKEALAIRVAQGIPPPHSRKCGSFDSLADADDSVQAGLQARMGTPAGWEVVRDQLMTIGAVPPPGIVEGLTGAGTALEKTDAGNGPYPVTAMPTWYSGGAGSRALYPGDTRTTSPTGTPLTSDVRCTQVKIRILADPNAPGGWYVNSAWPQ
jgi:hypothetical protein